MPSSYLVQCIICTTFGIRIRNIGNNVGHVCPFQHINLVRVLGFLQSIHIV